MFKEVLDETRKSFGPRSSRMLKEEFFKKVSILVAWLFDDLQYMMSLAEAVFSGSFFCDSEVDKNYFFFKEDEETGTVEIVPALCEFRIRPEEKYYESQDAPVPSFSRASGIALRVYLLRALSIRNRIEPPTIHIVFQVWGYREREAFKCLFHNYRRIVEILVKNCGVEFECSCWFDELSKYKGKSVMRKLDLYLQEDDDENEFSLYYKFDENFELSNVIRAFLVLTAIYDSCYHYLKKRKNVDRILELCPRLR